MGTRCYVVLLLAAPDDASFLQVEGARRSALEQFSGRPRMPHDGQRVLVGRQSASDILLGWSRGPRGRDFDVRQLRDRRRVPRSKPRLRR